MFSNKIQKVILTIGAIVFIVVMLTLNISGRSGGGQVFIGEAFTRGISVIVATILLLFLTKTRKKM